MGILLLAVFVAGSIMFSLWAWRNYDAVPQKGVVGQNDPEVLVIVIALLGGGLPEVLRHYTKWPLGMRFGLSLAVIAAAQYLAFRVLKRVQQKG